MSMVNHWYIIQHCIHCVWYWCPLLLSPRQLIPQKIIINIIHPYNKPWWLALLIVWLWNNIKLTMQIYILIQWCYMPISATLAHCWVLPWHSLKRSKELRSSCIYQGQSPKQIKWALLCKWCCITDCFTVLFYIMAFNPAWSYCVINQLVFRSVPSTKSKVKPTQKGNLSVNDNHLLMMRPPLVICPSVMVKLEKKYCLEKSIFDTKYRKVTGWRLSNVSSFT